MGRIVVPYKPREVFKPFHDRKTRWSVIVAHRRCGKTVACINDIIKRAILCEKPEGRFAYIAPLFNQAKDVAWSYLKRYASPILASQPNETELRVDLINGARIRLYGADNPDRLRGLYLDDVILDEYADMHPAVWGEVVRPMLTDRQGSATFIGTPKGHNSFYHLWEDTLDNPEWFRLMLKASETGLISETELQAAAKEMTPEQYQQEFECSWSAAITGSIYGKYIDQAVNEGRITDNIAVDPKYPIYTAWDLGFGDSTAIWFYQVGFNEIMIVDCYENSGEGIDHYCKIVKEKFPKERYHVHYVPHDAANKLQAAGGRSIIEQMKTFDIGSIMCVPATSQENSIEALRMTLPKCWFHATNCYNGIEALRMYRYGYDEINRNFKTKPLHDWSSHFADAAEIIAVMWQKKPLTTQQLKDHRIENKFKSLRRFTNMDKEDPYRLKPMAKKR